MDALRSSERSLKIKIQCDLDRVRNMCWHHHRWRMGRKPACYPKWYPSYLKLIINDMLGRIRHNRRKLNRIIRIMCGQDPYKLPEKYRNAMGVNYECQ